MASTNRWIIKDGLGNVVNTIIADESFVKQHYSNYEMFVPIIQEQDPERVAKLWRNIELRKTDEDLRQLADHPENSKWLAWRKTLRDWPSTTDFPNTLPTRPYTE
tara:strand:+ start:1742 stop:2056 length:315 start_codon:yes stop_codon:yes gene_type:complete